MLKFSDFSNDVCAKIYEYNVAISNVIDELLDLKIYEDGMEITDLQKLRESVNKLKMPVKEISNKFDEFYNQYTYELAEYIKKMNKKEKGTIL